MARQAKGVVESSPGRAEKLQVPPRLVSLLRGRSGNRSRRMNIARASPMFAFRRRINGGGAEQVDVAGEPSSPKVTCIGQVRIRNKNKKKDKEEKKLKAGDEKKQQQRCSCRCFCRALFCKPLKTCGGAARSLWRVPCTCSRWWALPPLRFRNSRSYNQRRQSPERYATPPLPAAVVVPRFSVYSENSVEYKDVEDEEDEEEAETKLFVSSATTTPPKNALLLMRCRSAPHNRSSSLATRFWVSPLAELPAKKEETATQRRPTEDEATKEEEEERVVVGRESFESREGTVARTNEDHHELEEQQQLSGSVHSLVLMRSKSEPAKKAAKVVMPEASFWNNRTTSGRRRLAALAQIPNHRNAPFIPTTEPSS